MPRPTLIGNGDTTVPVIDAPLQAGFETPPA